MSTYDQRFLKSVKIADGLPLEQNLSGIISDLDRINTGTLELVKLATGRSRVIRRQWWVIAGLVVALTVAVSLVVTGTEWLR